MESSKISNNTAETIERDTETEKKLTKAFSDHIFKAIVLLLYFHEDQYINYLNDSVNAYIDFIEQHNIIEKVDNVKIPIETNKQLKLWIEYPAVDDNKDIKYHVKGKILFSELNQPRIYIKVMTDKISPIKISATQDWLYLAETIMDHHEVTDKEKRKKLGREGWNYKHSVNEAAVKPDVKVEEKIKEEIKEEKIKEEKIKEKIEEEKVESTKEENIKITQASINKMKVTELKKYLKDNNLSCVGKKDELKNRLLHHYKY